MQRHALSTLALALLLGAYLSACATATQTRTSPLAPIDGNYLWSIQDPKRGGETVAHVMGSIHMLYEGATVDGTMLDAFEQSGAVAVEVDLDAVSYSELIGMTQRYGHFPEGQ
ncbi:MAG: TraB/GumN family protein, partial [Myxococcota bacterium]|nr:TraB/GumN family protein [Myxococcota bacterium]